MTMDNHVSVLRKYETNGTVHYIDVQTTDYRIYYAIRNYAESVIRDAERPGIPTYAFHKAESEGKEE